MFPYLCVNFAHIQRSNDGQRIDHDIFQEDARQRELGDVYQRTRRGLMAPQSGCGVGVGAQTFGGSFKINLLFSNQ